MKRQLKSNPQDQTIGSSLSDATILFDSASAPSDHQSHLSWDAEQSGDGYPIIMNSEQHLEAHEIFVPGYYLQEEIGRGGMGVVYRAQDLETGREVAIKILHMRYAKNRKLNDRFYDEASITRELCHVGIPAVVETGISADLRPYLAMEMIEGKTLEQAIGDGDPIDSLAVFSMICEAVGYAHENEIIHRDLKPSNIMISPTGDVNVIDWGLAKMLKASEADWAGQNVVSRESSPRANRSISDTEVGSVLGTPGYMPPEQAAGEMAKVSKRSDVFGLGALLCVLLTGKPPYACSTIEDTGEHADLGNITLSLRKLDECGADARLIDLAKRCLANDPSDRPESGQEVADAITHIRQSMIVDQSGTQQSAS